ncbi:hypothetical protein BC941DRAFT_401151 [Chlamydoabsidia padenii]|nr:hypothetical protein BC941DRAFT_401151 [Chlamydoabsidia padenii]
MEFNGKLFTYHKELRLTAFESGVVGSNKTVIFMEGLTDGYNGVPYLSKLNDTVTKHGYSLIQIHTTSFYNGYGASSLSNDAKELDYLIDYLRQHRNRTQIVVMGHSTGCQDCYWHNKYGRNKVAGYILQAPASDREYYVAECQDSACHIQLAVTMREQGRGSDWMPRFISDVPVTADRFYSLHAYGGDDDVFSTDLTDDELDKLYKDVNQPMMVIHGQQDEFYKSSMDPMVMLQRLQKSCPAIKKIAVVPGANHKIFDPQAQTILMDLVSSFLDMLKVPLV